MKNSIIFLIQACVVSAMTVILGAEAFLYYKQEIEKPVRVECPAVRCPDCVKPTNTSNYDYREVACINKRLYLIDGDNIILMDKNDNEILCFKSDEVSDLTGYNLFSKDNSYGY